MIPDPSFFSAYPELRQRAFQQADMFVQQTRMQAQAQMMQQQAAFTGGVGGGQPGLMGYATSAMAHLPAALLSNMQHQAQLAAMRVAAVPGAAAAAGIPAFNQFMDVMQGARYAGGGLQQTGLAGLLGAGYAPLGVFPHAGMAFGMERDLRREMAREELGRRASQFGRATVYGGLHTATLGLSSYVMRRTGFEASWMGEMQTERELQRRLGFLRGGQFEAATGFGVRREFFTQGPGAGAIDVLQERAGALQARYGYSPEQMNLLTRVAAGAVDVTRVQQYGARGAGGMRELGREIADIRQTAGAMAREMQMSERELEAFFGQLRGVMRITGEGLRTFQEENRRIAMQGPFSQQQVGMMRMQFMQMGRGAYLGGAEFGTEAVRMANQVAQLRRTGAISAETLLREGGGLDPEAMARMTAQRLQQQIGLVQGGAFNQAMVLGQAAPGAFARMLGGGAGFFETQAALGGALLQNPFALQMARMNREVVRNITFQAPMIAFRQAQQMGPLLAFGTPAQRRAQMIETFGRQMGFDVNTPQGAMNAMTRYEEIEFQREDFRGRLESNIGVQSLNLSQRQTQRVADELMTLTATAGASADEALGALESLRMNENKFRTFMNTSDPRKREALLLEGLDQERAVAMERDLGQARTAMEKGRWSNLSGGEVLKKLGSYARDLERKDYSPELIAGATFGYLADWRTSTDSLLAPTNRDREARLGLERIVSVGQGKFEVERRQMRLKTSEARNVYARYKTETGRTIRNNADRVRALRWYAAQEELAGRSPWETTREELTTLPEDVRYAARLGGRGGFERIVGGEVRGLFDEVDEERFQQGRRQVEQMIRGGGPVVDILSAVGAPIAGDRGLEALAETISDLDVQHKELANDKRMAPILDLAKRASATDYGALKLSEMGRVVSMPQLRTYFKEFAATDAGKRVMEEVGVGREQLEKAGTDRLQQIYQGMGSQEQRRLFGFLGLQAIERSQRLTETAERGSELKPMYVIDMTPKKSE